MVPCILPHVLTPHILFSLQNHSLCIGVLSLQQSVHQLTLALSQMQFCSFSPPPPLSFKSSSLACRDTSSSRSCAVCCSQEAGLWIELQPVRETIQNTELKRAKIALFSLPCGTRRELCVRVRCCINWFKSHTKKAIKLCICIQTAIL